MTSKILLVEDDANLAEAIRVGLSFLGYEVAIAPNAVQAQTELLAGAYSLLILDLGLPQVDGLELLKQQRTKGNAMPVIVLTARDAVEQKVRALDLGADDYLVKPVVLDELAARIRARLRRAQGLSNDCLINGDLTVNLGTRTVSLRGVLVPVSPREFGVLVLLMQGVGRVQSREKLEKELYGWSVEIESNSLEVHIHHLRKKLGEESIRTVRGVGYMIPRAEAK